MPDLFNLNIYTPQGVLYSSSAKRITALYSLGQFGVLPGHTIFASDIVNGEMQVLNDSGEEVVFEVGDGLISVDADNVTVALESGKKK